VGEITALFFERVYRLVGDDCFHWDCPFTVYLRTVLLNLSRDEARRLGQRRKKEVSLDDEDVATAIRPRSKEPSAEESVLLDERRRAVHQVLAQLDPGDRHIVKECLLEGRSGQELASRLGIKRDALYQRLHRAKKRLKRLMEEHELLCQLRGSGRSDTRELRAGRPARRKQG
jgi:RNA polymerase sigma factor (sigma-70 family)